ncbi:VOC family protein [Natroniella sp. ANB-PHB2]|uniref:VOC family protein n=1 Tax=Natroniella sp. ANB-PHB2 TaxID=3384444 RepID=UPI0038D3D8BD
MLKGTFSSQLVVSDVERSIKFYKENLGLDLILGPTEPLTGSKLSNALKIPDVNLRMALFKVGESALLELYEVINPKPETNEPISINSIGASRINFVVEDIEATKKELEAKGVEFFSSIKEFEGRKWVVMSDPDGIGLELVQLTE